MVFGKLIIKTEAKKEVESIEMMDHHSPIWLRIKDRENSAGITKAEDKIMKKSQKIRE